MTSSTATGLPERLARFGWLERRVRDLPRSIAFHVDGLGFRLLGGCAMTQGDPPGALLGLGDQRLVLRPVPSATAATAATAGTTVFAGPDVRFQHAAIVARDMDAALRRLLPLAPGPITRGGPQRLPVASGGVTAFKFRDPDGHPLELLEFPADDVPARWRGPAGAGPTLGIDHLALAVADVVRSVAFYERLGFRVAGRQLNTGAAQARLDGLDAADGAQGEGDVAVDVVALRLPRAPGPHLELLGYRRPAPVVAAAAPDREDGDDHALADRAHWIGMPSTGAFADPDGHRHRWTEGVP